MADFFSKLDLWKPRITFCKRIVCNEKWPKVKNVVNVSVPFFKWLKTEWIGMKKD